jgi:hypothetical protein
VPRRTCRPSEWGRGLYGAEAAAQVPNQPEGSVRFTSTPSQSISLMRSPGSESTSGEGWRVRLTPVKPCHIPALGLQQSFNGYGTWLLSQAFPEGSPTHPAYPTGHGTVGGACITVLKFFFDGNFVIPNPAVPTSDGLSLVPYTGSDANQLTVNGELNKLGHNVSFGHGIHAGIHWRSDSDTSLLLGEAVALSFLRDRAKTYNEPFTVKLTKFDGTTATISNQ